MKTKTNAKVASTKTTSRKERGGDDAPSENELLTKKSINVPLVSFSKLTLRIVGETPLLCHAWSTKALRMIEEKQQKKAGTDGEGKSRLPKEARDPDKEVDACYYYTSDNRLGFPARAIKKACVEAAPLVGLNKKTVRAGFFILGEDVLPLDLKSAPAKRTDVVRLPSIGRPADIRYRPEFKDWSILLKLKFNRSLFTEEQIINLIRWAGSAIGIGEWRTERDGTHGCFDIDFNSLVTA
jgi:hypothetical protein